jgi:outer membrane autotransporter protein
MNTISHNSELSEINNDASRMSGRVKLRLLKTVSTAAISIFIIPGAFAQSLTVSSSQDISGAEEAGILVNNGANATGSDVTSTATGVDKYALEATATSTATFSDSDFTTNGDPTQGAHAYVVYAHDNSSVSLTNGTVTSASTGGQNSTSPDTRDYALYTNGVGSSITADGTTIQTNGFRSYGAYAVGGSTIDLNNVGINTTGSLGYGLYASGSGSEITATDTNVTTSGFTGDGVWAFDGGHVTLNGGTITINGGENPNDPHEAGVGLLALGGGYQDTGIAGVIDATDITIENSGVNGIGIQAGGDVGPASTYGTVMLTDSNVTLTGAGSTAAYAQSGSTFDISGSTLTSVGTAVDVSGEGTTAALTNTAVTSTGDQNAYGVSATEGAAVTINGGSVTTQSTVGQNDLSQGEARGYALYAADAGSAITANGTTIVTNGERSYGAYALAGTTIDLTDTNITTNGALGYGLYARDGGAITATNTDVTTNGFTGDGVWAYRGGHVTLKGGTFTVNGGENPNDPHEAGVGLLALGGDGEGGTAGVIDATGVTVVVKGDRGFGIEAGGDVGANHTFGTINLTNSTVTTTGTDAIAAYAQSGSTFDITGSKLAANGANNIGVQVDGSGTVSLTGTTVTATAQSIQSNLDSVGAVQTININNGSAVTANNGKLLVVTRTNGGTDGQLTFNLNAGSTTSGDITDTDEKTDGGFTDVNLSSQATYSGAVSGVRNFSTDAGGNVTFQGQAHIEGDLDGNNTKFTFSQQGATIGGDVNLVNGSSTTGGSIATPIYVGGDGNVDATSTLGGNWNFAGSVTNSGVTNPGNSIGLIIAGGNYTFAPTSTYVVEVNAAGQSDRVQAGGVATLAGAVTVTPLGGVLLNSPYTIVTAGSISGTFSGVTFTGAGYPFLTASLGYSPTTAFVQIARSSASFAALGTTPNQVAVGVALNGLGLNGALVQALALGSAANAAGALDQLTGEAYASVRTGLFEDSRFVRNAVSARLAETPSAGMSVWGNAYGSWGENDAKRGFASLDRRTRGLFLGLDTSIGDTARIGILGGYSHSDFDVDGRASRGDSENYQAAIYAGGNFGGFKINAGAAYTWHRIDMDRSVGFTGFTDSLSSRYNAHTAQVFGDIGYAMPLGTGEVGPFIGAAYVRVHTDGLTERGGAAALTVAGQTSDVTFSTVGLRAKTGPVAGESGLSAHAMVGWRHAFNDRLSSIQANFTGGSSFTALGIPLSKDTAVVDLGLDVAMGSRTSVGVSYAGQIGTGSSDNGVKAHLTIAF